MLFCEECGSQAVEISGLLRSDAPVRCSECGRYWGDYHELVALISDTLQPTRDRIGTLTREASPVLELAR
jgi:hypothetical protein